MLLNNIDDFKVRELSKRFDELNSYGYDKEEMIDDVMDDENFGYCLEEEIYEVFEYWKNNKKSNNVKVSREFKMYIEDTRDEDDFLRLKFSIDGKVVDSCEYDNIGDILYVSNEMFNKNCEKYNFNGMIDKLIIDLKYSW
jgi:hypothetical protein